MFQRPAVIRFTGIKAASGFTLVELMVAIAVGLVVTLFVTQAYVNGIGTQRTQTDATRLQEAGRFAFDALAHGLHKAGYRNPLASVSDSLAPGKNFCDIKSPLSLRLSAVDNATSIHPSDTSLPGTTGTAVAILNSSDVIRVRYYGEGNTDSNTADNSMLDCVGKAVAPQTLVDETYFVAADSANNNEPSLFCYSSNSSASGNVAIVPGIESMQLMFGEDTTPDPDGVIDRYVSAATGNISNFNNVRNVMLSLVIRSPNNVANQAIARTFTHFPGNTWSAPADGRLRQQMSTTIAIPNVCPPVVK